MKFFFLLFLLISCSEKNSNYFPLDKIKSWTYAVEIIPEVESKILYKKTNTSIGEKKIKYQVLKIKNNVVVVGHFHQLEQLSQHGQ